MFPESLLLYGRGDVGNICRTILSLSQLKEPKSYRETLARLRGSHQSSSVSYRGSPHQDLTAFIPSICREGWDNMVHDLYGKVVGPHSLVRNVVH